MTPRTFRHILLAAAVVLGPAALSSCGKANTDGQTVQSTKKERNHMSKGTDLYRKQRYAEAEVSYTKALEINPENQTALFNRASAHRKQRGEGQANAGDSLLSQATATLRQLTQSADTRIAQAASYDSGNLAYKAEDYAQAIEHYKNALRRNPSDDAARQNLRLAQLKQQQQQDQNKDDNKDDKQDQQDQQQQQQQQNQQQQDQNQDQQQNQDQKPPEQKQQDKGGLSQQNADQILKAMEDKENATRQKLERMKYDKERQASKRTTDKPW